jgi:adenylate cyclase
MMAGADPQPASAAEVPALDMDVFNRALLDSVAVGLALVTRDSGRVVFHNRRFADLFPALAADTTIDQLVAAPDLSTLGEEPVKKEMEVKVGRRAVTLSVQFSLHEVAGEPVVLIECHNISKIKELEYMIDSYSKMVEKNARDLRREKERAERLLLNVMPKSVYEELKAFGVTTPQRYENVSILMLDFVGFTALSNRVEPMALISELNDIFTAFDRIVEQFGCERIKTIGDAYMAVSGLPEENPDHARNIAKVAVLLRRYIRERGRTRADDAWQCRIGIASGPVIGSIVGIQKYVYDIFGPGVNLASRMETLSDTMEITVSDSLYQHIRSDFQIRERGVVDIKGFGQQPVYTLVSAQGSDLTLP